MKQISKHFKTLLFIFILSSVFVDTQSQRDSLQVVQLISKSSEQLKAGKKKEALVKADSALQVAKELGLGKYIISAHHSKALCLDALKKPKLAMAEYAAALDFARSSAGSSSLEIKALEQNYIYYLSKRKYTDALNFQNQLVLLRDSIVQEEMMLLSSANDSLEIALDAEKQSNEAKLTALTADSRGSVEKYGLLFSLFIGFFVLTIMALIFFIRKNGARLRRLNDDLVLANYKISDMQRSSSEVKKFLEIDEIRNLQAEYTFYQEVFDRFNTVKTQLEQVAKLAGSSFPVDKYLVFQNTVSKLARELRARSSNVSPEVLRDMGLSESLKLAFVNPEQSGDRIVFSCSGAQWSQGFLADILIFRLITGIIENIKSRNGSFNGNVDLKYLADELEIVIGIRERVVAGDLNIQAYNHILSYLQAKVDLNVEQENLIDIRIILPNISNADSKY